MLTRLGLVLTIIAAGACDRPALRLGNPAAFAGVDYDHVFDAAIVELRERRFIIDRDDRRFGVVTTRPLTASTILEPWYRDDTSLARVGESTLNADRRIVRVSLTPFEGAERRYRVGVEVQVERRQLPPRQLTTSAMGAPSLTRRGRDRFQRAVRTEEGRQEVFWKPIARDQEMEQRLLDAILSRAAAMRADEPSPGSSNPPT